MLRVVRIIRAHVVVGAVCVDRLGRVVGVLRVVQRRVVDEVVEVVRLGRSERGGRGAELRIGFVLVRGERLAVRGDVRGERLVRVRQRLLDAILERHGVEHADRECVVDRGGHGAVLVDRRRVQAQWEQLLGHLHAHRVGLLAVRDGDDQVGEVRGTVDRVAGDFAFERVGRGLAVFARLGGLLRELLACEHNAGEVLDRHVFAEFVGEGDGAALHTRLGRGGDRRARLAGDGGPDVVEDARELVGVRGVHVVVGVRRALSEFAERGARRVRVVARYGLHVAVGVRGQIVDVIGLERAHCIDQCTGVLERFCFLDGLVAIPWIAVGEEDDDGIGVRAFVLVNQLVGELESFRGVGAAKVGQAVDDAFEGRRVIGEA